MEKAPIIMIDEYDAPIQEGYSKKFYEEIVGFMRNFFSGAFKDNRHLSYGFLTGILRIAQESIFSGLNNPTVNSILDEPYDKYFGFTRAEVHKMLRITVLSKKKQSLKPGMTDIFLAQKKFTIPGPWSTILHRGVFQRHIG